MTKYTRNKKSSSSHSSSRFKRVSRKEMSFAVEKYAWTNATCPVCMEFPHSAVLLLCSSHGNGCRPYICASSYQHSNCLDQLVMSCRKEASEDPDAIELVCPLCRGEVKGYTLVEPARKQLNRKRRSCMEDGCSYMGTYRELCKHVQKKHPSANPRAVDPLHAYRWKRLLFRSSLHDMICSTTSEAMRRFCSHMLQIEEVVAALREGGDHRGATNDDQLIHDLLTSRWNVRTCVDPAGNLCMNPQLGTPADSQFLTRQSKLVFICPQWNRLLKLWWI